VAWWRQDGDALTELLVIAPGPAPRSAEAWPTHLAQSLSGPGEWAVLQHRGFAALDHDLAAQLEHPELPPAAADESLEGLVVSLDGTVLREPAPAAPDALYERTRRQALQAVTRRIADPLVASDPASSGVVLARLRIVDGSVALDLAPGAPSLARIEIVTAEPGGAPEPVPGLERSDADVDEDDVVVALPAGGGPVRLPATTLRWPCLEVPAGMELAARVDVAVPELHLRALRERLGVPAGAEPLFRMRLAAYS
jgi:hypothetical protein